jgi:tetratricopeptide (TPR) repeat protein
MDLTNHSGENQSEKASTNNEAKVEKRTIFELSDESFEEECSKPEAARPDQSKDFLEKLHIRNHELNSVETFHELYRGEVPKLENEIDLLPEEDEYLFNEVQKAVSEKDIIDLRANLQAISKTIPSCQLTVENIEKYLDGDLDPQEYELIQNDIQLDVNLASEIDLYGKINEAIGEKDIMQLRSDLRTLIITESSHSRTLEEIDDYLSGELDEQLKNLFEDELLANQNLASEVKLFNEIDEAITEKDVMDLRSSLNTIGKEANKPEIRGIRGSLSLKLTHRFLPAVAASIIVILGINIIFHSISSSNPKIYSEYYQPAEFITGTTRSAINAEELMMNQALTMLSIKEYDQALQLFSDILAKDDKNPAANFYAGTIYQMKEQYADAIKSFTMVTEEGDNLFVEQADWYLGLCFLKMDQRKRAIDQFNKLSKGNGYYYTQSISILKKLE